MKGLLRKAASFPVLLGTILVASVAVATQSKLADPDMFLHVAVGRQILTTGAWPVRDTFSFTAQGDPCMAFEWLGQVLIARAARLGGFQALLILLTALGAGLALLLYYYAYLRSGNAKAAFIACLALWPLMVLLFSLRPQMLGYCFLLITLICLERFRQGRRTALWFLPVVFLLWVNTHGTFVLGLFALGVYWAGGLAHFCGMGLEAKRWTPRERLQLEIVSLLCVLALTLTPYGTRLAAYPLELVMNSPLGMAHISEFRPVTTWPAATLAFLLPLVLFVAAQIIWRPRYRVEEAILFLTATGLAWLHLRLLFFFMLTLVPLAAAWLAKWVPGYDAGKDRRALNAVLMFLLGLGVVRLFPSQKALEAAISQQYPQQALEYLRQHPVPGPLFNQEGWGGYLIWSALPRRKVFIDTRSLLYEEAGVYADFLHIMAVDPETPRLLRKYGVASCLIARQEPLATFLASQPGWQRVYRDPLSTIFVRKTN